MLTVFYEAHMFLFFNKIAIESIKTVFFAIIYEY